MIFFKLIKIPILLTHRVEEMITNKKKLLIVEQILLVRTERKVWRICIYIDVRV